MRKFASRMVCYAMALLALSSATTGCVKRMSPANEPAHTELSSVATLRSVDVSADASRIELSSDRPFTYTSYRAGEKIVIDLSQTVPGALASPVEVNRGNLKRIDLLRQPVGGGVLTRVELSLAREADYAVTTDALDRGKLVVSLIPPEEPPAAAAAGPEPKEPVLAEARIEEKSLIPPTVSLAAVEGGNDTAPAAPTAAPAEPKSWKAEAESAAQPSPAIAGRRLNAVLPAADGVDLSIEGGVQTFNSFRLARPDRIVLDMFGMKSAVPQNVIPIGAFGVANARVGSTPDKVRVVLDAQRDTLPPFEVVKSDLGLKIRLKGERGSAAAAPLKPVVPAPPAARELPVPPPSAVASEVEAKKGSRGALETLDFNVVDGVSRITMKLHGSCDPGEPVAGPQGLTLTVRNCEVPKQLQRSLDASEFGSPVVSITPYQVKVKGAPVAKVLVRLRGNPPYSVKRRGEVLVWDITNPGPLPVPTLPAAPAEAKAPAPAPPAKAPAEQRVADELVGSPRDADQAVTELPVPAERRPVRKVYTGRRVTLEFSDADIRKIFQLIAEVSNLNFLIADDVSGTISLKLVNVPWDQALDVILDAKGLGMQRDGNIVQIKPKAKIQTQAEEEMAARKAAERVMEMRTSVFEVNYAAVGDVASQFSAIKSERGTITMDPRTSRVIVKDIQPALDEMRALLKTLDAPEKQVMIEARIVEATSTFTRDLGVQWGLSYQDASASLLGINAVDTGFGGVVSAAGPGSTGTGGIGLGMSFGKLNSNVQLDMRLSAAATIGQIKIISTPKVVTLNNKPAKISQGQSIPYQTTSAEGTKTEFVEAALTLEVTPHITSEGTVSMKIKASNNSPGASAGDAAPPINKKEATTELLVANGETTVIGGIYVDSDTESDTGVPFLSDIPLLGWLFKSNSKQKTKTELLIFITPKVVI